MVLFLLLALFQAMAQKSVAALEMDFNRVYTAKERLQMLNRSLNNQSEDRNGAGHYYMAYTLEGVIQAWQATGREDFLKDVQLVFDNLIASAKELPAPAKGFQGWAVTAQDAPIGQPLYESYTWRHLCSFLRIMHQSPRLKKQHEAWFQKRLAWTEKNIWDKWASLGQDRYQYRVNTYMTSHWARIAMELYLITEKDAYLQFFENVSFKGHPAIKNNHLRNRLYDNVTVNPPAFNMYSNWETPSSPPDASHFADLVSFWTTAAENNMYWNQPPFDDDMQKLISTYFKVVHLPEKDLTQKSMMGAGFIDGTSDQNGIGPYDKASVSLGTHINLGRFDEAAQTIIETYFTPTANIFNKPMLMGISLNNRKILTDGKPVYPENYSGTGK